MTTNRASLIWTCGLYWISANHGVETNLIGKFYAIRTNCVFRNIGTIVKAYPASNHKNLEFPAVRHSACTRYAFDIDQRPPNSMAKSTAEIKQTQPSSMSARGWLLALPDQRRERLATLARTEIHKRNNIGVLGKWGVGSQIAAESPEF